MGILILLLVGLITFGVYCQDAYNDSASTIKSKNDAKTNNGVYYNQYGGGGKIKTQRLLSTGEKVTVDVFGNVIGRNGRIICNLDDVYRNNLLQESKRRCEARGYKGFYLYTVPHNDKISTSPLCHNNYTYLCIETETNRLFWWRREKESLQKDSEGPFIFKKIYKTKPGSPTIEGSKYEFSIDIRSDLNRIYSSIYRDVQCQSTWWY